MMGKVDRKVKKEVNFEFLPWDFVLYKYQIENYFKIIRKLSGEGFNRKANFPPNIVFDVNIVEVFRSSFEGFKTTNLNIHLETKKDLLQLYWKVYGTKQIMNNEFMICFVKGYIAHKKGEKVNRARAIASTS
jgi:hypothetical protein